MHFTMEPLLAVKMEYLAVLAVVAHDLAQRVLAILLQLVRRKAQTVADQ